MNENHIPPAPVSAPESGDLAAPRRQLTLFDSTSIIVGIIIGVGIYETTPLIANKVPDLGWLFLAWLLGGFFSLVGAMCYAELARAYPKAGGDYVYLTRALGRKTGFVFVWTQLWVVRPGSIGVYAFVFARYANELFPLATTPEGRIYAMLLYAMGAVVALSAINILGVPQGKWTQNVLTVAKVLGLLGIVVVGLAFSAPASAVAAQIPAPPAADWEKLLRDFGFAMIFVFFAYSGWNEMAYVGAEVRDPDRNIFRALLLGTLGVTAIYLLVTGAFIHALGLEGVRSSNAVAAEVLKLGLGEWGGKIISLIICLSALGAINGMIFTGARVYYAMGTEHRLYAPLGRWSPRLGTPVVSLVVQAVITLGLMVGFGLSANGFESMVKFTTPVFWIFLLLVGIGVFVLRVREADLLRPYRVPGGSVAPVLFCLYSSYMIYTSLTYAWEKRSPEMLWSLVALGVGLIMMFFDPRPDSSDAASGDVK